jgi:hypothetical protein
MFEQQQVTIKSGSGDNYFEATASFDRMADDSQTNLIVEGLKQMQRDRMNWAARQSAPLAQKVSR